MLRFYCSFLLSLVHVEASATSVFFPIFALFLLFPSNLRCLILGLLERVLRPLVLLGLLLCQLLLFQLLLLLLGGLLVSERLQFGILLRFLQGRLVLFEGFVLIRLLHDDGTRALQDLGVADQDV